MDNERLFVPFFACIGSFGSVEQAIEEFVLAQILETTGKFLVAAYFLIEKHSVEHIGRWVIGYEAGCNLVEIGRKVSVLQFGKGYFLSFHNGGYLTHILVVKVLFYETPLFPVLQRVQVLRPVFQLLLQLVNRKL